VEHAIDPASRRSRSIDVILDRPTLGEIAVVELVDLFADGGDAMRGLADKVAVTLRSAHGMPVAGLLVLRSTRRNRELMKELRPFGRSAVPGLVGRLDRSAPGSDTPDANDGRPRLGTRRWLRPVRDAVTALTATRQH